MKWHYDVTDGDVRALIRKEPTLTSDRAKPQYLVQAIANTFTVQGDVERVGREIRCTTILQARKIARIMKRHGSPSSIRILVK